MKQSLRLNTKEISLFFSDKPRPRKLVGELFVFYYKKSNLGRSKFTVTVSRKYGGACKRNLIRRRVKAIMASEVKGRLPASIFLVISVKPMDSGRSYDVIRGSLLSMVDTLVRDAQ